MKSSNQHLIKKRNTTPSRDLVIMNWNGVLIEVFDLCVSFAQAQNPEITPDQYMKMFDVNFFEAAQKVRFFDYKNNPTQVAVVEKFKKDIFKPGKLALPPYLGMKDVLKSISKDALLAINTSAGTTGTLYPWLEKNELHGLFSDLQSAEFEKSKAKKLQQLIEVHETTNLNAIYVTDKIGDAKEALSVNIPVILVTWGFQPKSHLSQTKDQVVAIVDTPQELYEKLQAYFDWK